MTHLRFLCWLTVGLLGSTPAMAGELVVLPDTAVLDGPTARLRLLLEERKGERFVGDRTSEAVWTIAPEGILERSHDGVLRPRADGRVTITATVGGHSATATVEVRGMGQNAPWSFRNHVLPVLTRNGCNSGGCHGAAAGKNGFRLTLRGYGPETDYDAITRQARGRRVEPSSPAESLLLLKPTGALDHGGGLRLEERSDDYRILAEWIGAGMPPPRADDPQIVELAVLPSAVSLTPGQSQQVLVRASYSDGRTEDVTHWSKFETTDQSVARVDESGRVRVDGHGEAAVTVWFSNRVAIATITAPYPNRPDPAVFAHAPRANRIDDLNLAKLESLGIPPSPDAGDAAFLRRAYLDTTGTLPPADRVDAFLDDPDPAKRAKLVEELLQSEAFVDYWAYKWADLFLVSSERLAPPAMWAFTRFLRDAVADNLPWDEIARRILTAKGSTLAHGAGNFFVLHRDPIDLTETASMAFLGLSLTCARCHNHPMEKWTQDQYYGMANLFARVSLKDGATAGEVVVTAAPDGGIRHPRTGAVVPAQPLDAPPLPSESRIDRREAFANWLTDPANPSFDRAIINRVWRNFFGRGLVEPEDDLRATNPPSDPALLDGLVADFRKHGRDLRHLMRTILNSAAYARSSRPLPGHAADPKFLSHALPRRLPAEVLLDALSAVTEVPTPFAGYPDGWRSLRLPDTRVANSFLDAFGRPERVNTCSCERSSEPSVAQALALANGPTLNEKLRSDKGLVARLVRQGATDDQVIDHLFRAALARRPTDAERAALTAVLVEASRAGDTAKDPTAARREAIEDLCWGILTGPEFLFNH